MNTSPIVKEYYDTHCELVKSRIDYRMRNINDNALTCILDMIKSRATDEELEDINNFPLKWWFEYKDNGEYTHESELDKFKYAKYFIHQEPRIIGNNNVGNLKGTPFFGGGWQVGDAYLYCMIQEIPDLNKHGGFPTGMLTAVQSKIDMISLSNRDYIKLEECYKFDRFSNKIPVFIKC